MLAGGSRPPHPVGQRPRRAGGGAGAFACEPHFFTASHGRGSDQSRARQQAIFGLFSILPEWSTVKRSTISAGQRGRSLRHLRAIVISLVCAAGARAQGNYEVQVYGSDLIPKGVTMVELHTNFTA